MNILKIKQAAEIAKSRTNDKRWLSAIDKAVAGVESGWWIITELADCLAITTETGNTYFANEKTCQCRAFELGQACKHRGLYRLVQMMEAGAPRPARVPRVTRSVERDRTGVKVVVVRCDGWMI